MFMCFVGELFNRLCIIIVKFLGNGFDLVVFKGLIVDNCFKDMCRGVDVLFVVRTNAADPVLFVVVLAGGAEHVTVFDGSVAAETGFGGV